MRIVFFIWLYGALSLVGFFLSGFWAFRARARRLALWKTGQSVRTDRYYILTLAIAVISFGLMLVDTGRLLTNLHYGFSPTLGHWEGTMIGAGLLVMLIGFFVLVWLADLEHDPPRYGWLTIGAAITIVWGVVSLFVADHVPLWVY